MSSQQKRKRISGVTSIDDLRARCIVDDITGCWQWGGSYKSDGRPSLWYPPLGRHVSLGVAIGHLLTGAAPRPGVVWHCRASCETADCANPAHRRKGTRSTQMLAAQLTRDPLTRARIAGTKRRASRLTDEQVAEIRASAESSAALARKYGISACYVWKIRTGANRGNTLAGASVFTFAGAAQMMR